MEIRITHKRALRNPQTGFLMRQNIAMPKIQKIDERAREILASNLDRLMENAGLNNEALGKKSGVGKSTIQRIRAKETTPSVDNVAALASALDVTLPALLSESGAAAPHQYAVVESTELVRLISNYAHATPDGKRQILDASEEAEKQSSGRFLIDVGSAA